MKVGEQVLIRFEGDAEWRDGTIAMIGGKVLALHCEAAILHGRHFEQDGVHYSLQTGVLALVIDAAGRYYDVVSRRAVEVREPS